MGDIISHALAFLGGAVVAAICLTALANAIFFWGNDD